MTLLGAFVGKDHVTVLADSGASDELGGMTTHHEKVARIADYPLVWAVTGAAHLNDQIPGQLSALAYDDQLPSRIRMTIGAVNAVEATALMVTGHNQGVAEAQLLAGFVAGYWPGGPAGIFALLANGTSAFSPVPWHFAGSGVQPAGVALNALHLFAGSDFAYTDHALDAVFEATAVFRRQDVGRPFRRWTITPDGVERSDWIDRLLPAPENT